MSSDIKQSPNHGRVWKLFGHCQKAFSKVGINISFPKNTSPDRTYKWRYLVAFLDRIDKEWNISDEAAFRIINEVVKIAVERKLLYKGLALLHADKIILEACERSALTSQLADGIFDRLKREHKTALRVDLLHQNQPNALPELVRLYLHNDISDLYLAASRRCHKAMLRLSPTDRSMLPNGKELLQARIRINANSDLKRRLRAILGGDFRGGL